MKKKTTSVSTFSEKGLTSATLTSLDNNDNNINNNSINRNSMFDSEDVGSSSVFGFNGDKSVYSKNGGNQRRSKGKSGFVNRMILKLFYMEDGQLNWTTLYVVYKVFFALVLFCVFGFVFAEQMTINQKATSDYWHTEIFEMTRLTHSFLGNIQSTSNICANSLNSTTSFTSFDSVAESCFANFYSNAYVFQAQRIVGNSQRESFEQRTGAPIYNFFYTNISNSTLCGNSRNLDNSNVIGVVESKYNIGFENVTYWPIIKEFLWINSKHQNSSSTSLLNLDLMSFSYVNNNSITRLNDAINRAYVTSQPVFVSNIYNPYSVFDSNCNNNNSDNNSKENTEIWGWYWNFIIYPTTADNILVFAIQLDSTTPLVSRTFFRREYYTTKELSKAEFFIYDDFSFVNSNAIASSSSSATTRNRSQNSTSASINSTSDIAKSTGIVDANDIQRLSTKTKYTETTIFEFFPSNNISIMVFGRSSLGFRRGHYNVTIPVVVIGILFLLVIGYFFGSHHVASEKQRRILSDEAKIFKNVHKNHIGTSAERVLNILERIKERTPLRADDAHDLQYAIVAIASNKLYEAKVLDTINEGSEKVDDETKNWVISQLLTKKFDSDAGNRQQGSPTGTTQNTRNSNHLSNENHYNNVGNAGTKKSVRRTSLVNVIINGQNQIAKSTSISSGGAGTGVISSGMTNDIHFQLPSPTASITASAALATATATTTTRTSSMAVINVSHPNTLSPMLSFEDNRDFEFLSVLMTMIPTEAANSFSFDVLLKALSQSKSLEFDCFEFESIVHGHGLFVMGNYLFREYRLLQEFNISDLELNNFLRRVERGYLDNPYHCSIHAVDVLQTFHTLICSSNFESLLDAQQLMAAILSCIIHDYNHPGVNNNFLIDSTNAVAILYNDISVLENYHVSSAWKLFESNDCNIFKSTNKDVAKNVRKMTIDMILATDMSKHGDLMGSFKNRLTASGEPIGSHPEDARIVMRMAIKLSDVSNPTKNKKLYDEWTKRILTEFYNQGDLERGLGLPLSPFMDRTKSNVTSSQIGFITFVVQPLVELWLKAFKESKMLQTNLETNLFYWKQMQLQNIIDPYDSPTLSVKAFARQKNATMTPAAATLFSSLAHSDLTSSKVILQPISISTRAHTSPSSTKNEAEPNTS